jgi:hypothetical protein
MTHNFLERGDPNDYGSEVKLPDHLQKIVDSPDLHVTPVSIEDVDEDGVLDCDGKKCTDCTDCEWDDIWDKEVDSMVISGRRWVNIGGHWFSCGKPTDLQEKIFQAHIQGQ